MNAVAPAASVPALYRDRDLAWLEFDQRVLREAADPLNPLLERVKFLAIAANNLDAFFMKRVGALKQRLSDEAGLDGAGDRRRLAELREEASELLADQAVLYSSSLLPELERHGIRIVAVESLDDEQGAVVRRFFETKVFPILTPLVPRTFA